MALLEPSDSPGGFLEVPPALRASPLPTLVVDPVTARVLSANAAAGDLAHDLKSYRTAREPSRLLADLVADGRLATVEVSCRSDDAVRSFLVYRSPLFGAAATSLVALSFAEVTELRAAEAALRREVEVRDEFFAVAAHELKDPLVSLQLALRLTLEMAADGGPADALVEYLEIGRRQSERLGSLMENLLDVSKIAGGHVRIDREAVDLAALAWEVTARLREPAHLAGSVLMVEAAVPVIGYFDRVKVEQILGNLVTNAIKYGEGRPVSVRVRGEGEEGVIEVEDSGRGVPPADQERIFGRFERAAGDHRRESLGLGLYIVKTYAEAHAGSAGVRSDPGRGSVFTVRLPLRRLPDHELDPESGTTGDEATGATP